jgi:type I restriction enzyme M protein
MSEELGSKYSKKGKIVGQIFGEYEYFQIGSTTFNQLSQSKIIPKTYNKKFNTHKPDRLIIDRAGKKSSVIAVIEDKKTGKFSSEIEKLKAIQQCNNYCQELNAKMGIITDNSITIWINPSQKNKDTEYEDEVTGKTRSYTLIKKEDGAEVIRNFKIEDKKDISNPEELDDDTRKLYKLIKEISLKINNKNSVIKEPERIDPLPLARRVWQDIWVATGKSPEKCLYNVVELFIFKFLSDLEILSDPNDFDSLYNLIEKNKKPEEVLRYYVNNCRKKIYNKDNEDDCLFPAGSDGTTIINGTIFVDESGKANITQAILFRDSIKKFKDFEKEFGKFSTHNIDKDFKTKLYEAFLKQTAGLKSLGQFFTPRKVIRSIIEMSGISNFSGGERVCDPFCGVGGFVLEPLNLPERSNDFRPKNKKIKSPIDYKGYDKGFEKDEERTIILAKANMLIYLSELVAETKLTREFAKNAFNKTFHLWRSNLGTLQEISTKEEEKFNLILTNPPYVKRGIKTLKNEIAQDTDLSNFYKINGGGLEGLALEWIIRHLKKGGKAFVVIPDGILNRLDDKNLRSFILQECYLDGIISLPQKTFYATPKKTYILAITKKENIEDKQKFPVYTYLVSNIGETLDINRFETPEKNDLPEMVDLFGEYLIYKTKDKIKELNNKSARCKIQPIEHFEPEKHWSIDRWWTREEKIELGIEEEEDEITPEEFFELLEGSYKELGSILKQREKILKKKSTESKKKEFKTISLDDTQFFDLNIGKRLLKRDLFRSKDNPKAKVPAYSANVFTPFGYVEKSNINNFNNPFILWGIDGNFDLNYKTQGELFASTDHCGTIEILDNKINPEYLLLILNLKRFEYGFDRGLRANLVNVRRVEIEIPLDEKGEFDLSYQKEIVEKNSEIFDLQKKIKDIREDITKSELNFSEQYEYEEKPLSELFQIKQGNAYYTKKRILGNGWKGDIPVYSSNTKEQGLLMRMDLSKIKKEDIYYQYCLTWSVDGYAGKLFTRNENNKNNEKKKEFYFTINNHSGILIPKSDKLYLPFIKEVIQPIFFKKSKGYGNNKVGTNQIKDIVVKVPIEKKGEFDLEIQKEISGKYRQAEELKKELTDKLNRLSDVKISIE